MCPPSVTQRPMGDPSHPATSDRRGALCGPEGEGLLAVVDSDRTEAAQGVRAEHPVQVRKGRGLHGSDFYGLRKQCRLADRPSRNSCEGDLPLAGERRNRPRPVDEGEVKPGRKAWIHQSRRSSGLDQEREWPLAADADAGDDRSPDDPYGHNRLRTELRRAGCLEHRQLYALDPWRSSIRVLAARGAFAAEGVDGTGRGRRSSRPGWPGPGLIGRERPARSALPLHRRVVPRPNYRGG